MLYAIINLMAVKWYGETEFWAALGKMLLIIGLIIYTFVAMLGKSLFPLPNTSTCSREF